MDEQLIYQDELEKWKVELLELKHALEREIEEHHEELLRLLARKDIIQSLVIRYRLLDVDDEEKEEFTKEWFEPLMDKIHEKRRLYNELKEKNLTKINQIELIINELG